MNSLKWIVIFMLSITLAACGGDHHIPSKFHLKESIEQVQQSMVANETHSLELQLLGHCYGNDEKNETTFAFVDAVLKELNDSMTKRLWIPLSLDKAICVIDQLFHRHEYFVEYDLSTQQILLDLDKEGSLGSKFIVSKRRVGCNYEVRQVPFCKSVNYHSRDFCSEREQRRIYLRYYFNYLKAYNDDFPNYVSKMMEYAREKKECEDNAKTLLPEGFISIGKGIANLFTWSNRFQPYCLQQYKGSYDYSFRGYDTADTEIEIESHKYC